MSLLGPVPFLVLGLAPLLLAMRMKTLTKCQKHERVTARCRRRELVGRRGGKVKKLSRIGYAVRREGRPYLDGEAVYVNAKWVFIYVAVWKKKAEAQRRCTMPCHKVVRVKVTELRPRLAKRRRRQCTRMT